MSSGYERLERKAKRYFTREARVAMQLRALETDERLENEISRRPPVKKAIVSAYGDREPGVTLFSNSCKPSFL